MKWNPVIRKTGLFLTAFLLSLGVLAFRTRPEAEPSTAHIPPLPVPAPFAESTPAALTAEQNASHLVDAIIQIESGGNARMVGRHGERGLMQIRSGTWRDMTTQLFGSPLPFDQAYDPALNRRVGTAYLAWLQSGLLPRQAEWKADERSLLLAAYNAGPGRLSKSGFSLAQMPGQTRDYVERASALHDRYLDDTATRVSAIPQISAEI